MAGRCVLDGSALLALLLREPGAERAEAAVLDGATMSTVNLSEVVSTLAERGASESEVRDALDPLELDLAAFDPEHAVATGMLRAETRSSGLSLADRACLAPAMQAGLPALTADRAWLEAAAGLNVEVVLIR